MSYKMDELTNAMETAICSAIDACGASVGDPNEAALLLLFTETASALSAVKIDHLKRLDAVLHGATNETETV